MPAGINKKNLNEPGYYHIFNKGFENRAVFNDHEDFETFLNYIKDYLSPAPHKDSVKQSFTVNGKTYHGTPHQPKNYNGLLELNAYCLKNNHFHLVMHQVKDGALERFMRSLATRYSMYFNKKYKRGGSLFAGPYKSVKLEDTVILTTLISYLHHNSGKFSSIAEYSGLNQSAWIARVNNVSTNYESDDKAKEVITKVNFESDQDHLEGLILERTQSNSKKEVKTAENAVKVAPKQLRFPEMFAAIIVFVVLFSFGVNNITANASSDSKVQLVLGESTNSVPTSAPTLVPSSTPLPTITPIVLPTSTPTVTPTATPMVIKKMLVIKITDGSESVNIRKSPTINSNILTKAKDGESYEYTSLENGWYKLVLKDGSGYVSNKYIQIVKTNN